MRDKIKEIKITKRQKEILKFIYNSIQTNGFPPTIDEFKDKFNISSNQAILDHLESLEKKELVLRKQDQSARNIKITPLGYKKLGIDPLAPIAGISYAGSFNETFEITDQWQELSGGEVKRNNKEVFLIKVSGDSMINAGINENDLLLAQSEKEFKSGDIVIAQTPEGTTIKRFISDDQPPFIYLKPENPKYDIIPFTHEMTLQAKIIGKWIEGKIISLIQGGFQWH